MSSTLRPEEQEAERFLKAIGLEVFPVPASVRKTPEFLVDGDARGYVVEVKTRGDAEAWIRAMKNGAVAYQERSMGYGRWAEDAAREAVKQFRSLDARHLRWWVLWLTIRCDASAGAMFEEAIGSLFGVRQVVYYDSTRSEQPMRDCLFARPGVFERHPDIIASVIDCGSGLSFCVNDEFAPDFSSFRESVLWSSFARRHPPTTAADLADNRGFFRADYSLNRKDDTILAAYLERTYGLTKAIIIDMRVHSASRRV